VAVPKRKTSRTNRDKRRTHDKIKLLNIVECPRCHSKKIAHNVCNECGYYKNTEIISEKEDKKTKPAAQEKTEEKEEAKKQ
jgi:large subunit ribosomal protein L32